MCLGASRREVAKLSSNARKMPCVWTLRVKNIANYLWLRTWPENKYCGKIIGGVKDTFCLAPIGLMSQNRNPVATGERLTSLGITRNFLMAFSALLLAAWSPTRLANIVVPAVMAFSSPAAQ